MERFVDRLLGRNNAEIKFWKSGDFATMSAVQLPPRSSSDVLFLFRAENLPRVHAGMEFLDLRPSVRSRYAQGALDMRSDDVANMLLESFYIASAQGLFRNGGFTADFFAQIPLFNRGERTVSLPQGAKVFRLFSDSGKHALSHTDLVVRVESGDIRFEGEEGKEWFFGFDEETATAGICVRILDENRRFIPPGEEPLLIDESTGDYRFQTDQILEEIPITEERIFWVGETVKITLADSLEGILDKTIDRGMHTSSQLFDGSKTNWRARVEVISPTLPELMPNYVFFYFVKRS